MEGKGSMERSQTLWERTHRPPEAHRGFQMVSQKLVPQMTSQKLASQNNCSAVSCLDLQKILIYVHNRVPLTWSNLSEPLLLTVARRWRVDLFKLCPLKYLDSPIWQLLVCKSCPLFWKEWCKEDYGLVDFRLLEISQPKNKQANFIVIGF